MRRRLACAAWALGLLALVAPMGLVHAKDKTLFIELERNADALPNAVNPTGTVVVGKFADGGSFYWMPTTGVIDLGGGFGTGVSADGDTIVGGARAAGILNAAIWLRGTEWRPLGSFANAVPCGDQLSQAYHVTRDGKVVVGSAKNGCTYTHAFRRQESGGMVDLGSLVQGRSTVATAVSGDGRVVVGFQDQADGLRTGARWVDGKEEVFQGPLGFVGAAETTNLDGSIVAGGTCVFGREIERARAQSAWVWTAEGGVECLPPPALREQDDPFVSVNYSSRAKGMSDDGRVIVGGQVAQGLSEDSLAVIWIDRKPVYLEDLLRANGVPDAFDGWLRTGDIHSVSPDGRVLVGWGAALGGFRGYIVVLGTDLVIP